MIKRCGSLRVPAQVDTLKRSRAWAPRMSLLGDDPMSAVRILAIVLIIAGPLGLVYGHFSYTRETQEAESFDFRM